MQSSESTVKMSGADLDRLADAALCHCDVSSVRLHFRFNSGHITDCANWREGPLTLRYFGRIITGRGVAAVRLVAARC
jgi:hypothetical protein